MSKSLAVKYRPKVWSDVTEQDYVKVILQNQIDNNAIKNAYLFCGGAGTGKTTTARIFANEINKGEGTPIEVDAASNNGVENVRTIIDDAKFKPLDSEYKVYIIDECHMLSNGAWNAMLKLLEEPPKTTIFLLCTTDPQKIPATILSRVQRYDFQRISFNGIVNRLNYIVKQENEELQICNNKYFENDDELYKFGGILFEPEALEYIAKIADGGMRDAISLLDKCIAFDNNLTVANVVKALGVSDYNNLDKLFSQVLFRNIKETINVIEEVYRNGKDLKQFMKQFIQYILDVAKYQIYRSYDYVQIPNTIDLTKHESVDYEDILRLLDTVVKLNNEIKYDTNPKVIIESRLILFMKK